MNTSANIYADDDIVRVLVELDGDCLLEQGYTHSQISAFGPQVTADAAKLLTGIGFADRQTVKIALRTVFAKSRGEWEDEPGELGGLRVPQDREEKPVLTCPGATSST